MNPAVRKQPKNSEKSIYLMVGDLYFGNQAKEVKTLLGSCVAITLWHPRLKVGGMCHIALPESNNITKDPMNTRYAEGAVHTFVMYMTQLETQPKEYITKVYGGGQMFGHHDRSSYNDIGAKNLSIAKKLLDFYRFNISEEDVSGRYYRHVCLDLKTGMVQQRKTPVSETMG